MGGILRGEESEYIRFRFGERWEGDDDEGSEM